MVEKEREIHLADQKKPAQVLDKIIEGKLEKFYTETSLEQPFIKDAPGKTKIKDLVDQARPSRRALPDASPGSRLARPEPAGRPSCPCPEPPLPIAASS